MERIAHRRRIEGLPGRTWDGLVDHALAPAPAPRLPGSPVPATSPGEMNIVNWTGLDLPPAGICQLDRPLWTPDQRPTLAVEKPVILAGRPTAGGKLLGISPGGLGRAQPGVVIVEGYAWCRVILTEPEHEFARPIPGNVARLESTAGAGYPLILGDTDPGERWAVVRLSHTATPGGAPIRGVTDEQIEPDGYGTVSIWRNGEDTEEDLEEVYLDWMHGDQAVEADTEVLVDWFADEDRFAITQAACEARA